MDKSELIDLLLSIDDMEFKNAIDSLEDIILNDYSEEFIREIKDKIFERYNKLSNINNEGTKTRNFKDGD